MAKFCGNCGSKLDETTKLCPYCENEKLQALERAGQKKNAPTLRRALVTILIFVVLIMGVELFFLFRNHSPEGAVAGQSQTSSAAGYVLPVDEYIEIVEDAYFDESYVYVNDYTQQGFWHYYHIPKINLDLPAIEDINKNIYQDLFYGCMMEDVYDTEIPFILKLAYAYGFKDQQLSILSCAYDSITSNHYKVYNISLDTGRLLSDEELIASFGFSKQAYDAVVHEALIEKAKKFDYEIIKGTTTEEFFNEQLELTLSEENKNKIKPYIDANSGDLCIIATIYTINGHGKDEYPINLTGTCEPSDPAEFGDITKRRGQSQRIWEPLTVVEFKKIRELLGVPQWSLGFGSPVFQYDELTFHEYTPEYWEEGAQWRRYVEIGIDGKLVAGAYVGTDSCELLGSVMMYSPKNNEPLVRHEESQDLSMLEGKWTLDKEETRDAAKKITFHSDGTADLKYPVWRKETLPYRQFATEPCVIIGSRKHLFSVCDSTLYLFPEGEKDDPFVYHRSQ